MESFLCCGGRVFRVFDERPPQQAEMSEPVPRSQVDAALSGGGAADGPAAGDSRRVVRLEGGPNAANPNEGFCTNTIVTQKYTCVNFVPKFLFESFMQVANFYFLVVGALQCWPDISWQKSPGGFFR